MEKKTKLKINQWHGKANKQQDGNVNKQLRLALGK